MSSIPLVASPRERERLPLVARAGAVLCALHCAAGPVLFALLPTAGLQWMEHPVLELSLVMLPAGALMPTLRRAWRRGDLQPPLTAVAGVASLLFGVVAPDAAVEIVAGLAGALLLLIASRSPRRAPRRPHLSLRG